MSLRNKKIMNKFWIPVMALNLLPWAALAAEDVAAQASEPHEMSLTEVTRTFRNFEAVKEGTDPNSQAVLFGMVFDACKDRFDFSNTQLDYTIKARDNAGSAKIGFRITDLGGGIECMTRKSKDSCSRANPCTRLSEIQGTRLDLAAAPDAQIMILHTDVNADRSRLVWEDFENPISHLSGTTLRARQEAQVRRERDERIQKLQRQLSVCRKSVDDLSLARDARDQLSALGAIDEEQFDKVTGELDRAEYLALSRKFTALRANDVDGREELVERLKAFEAEHPDYADSIAILFTDKAKAIVKNGNASPESLDSAGALIGEAQSLSGLSENNSGRLENYQREIKVGKLQGEAQRLATLAASGDQMTYWSSAQSFAQSYGSVQTELNASYSASCSGATMASENCRSVLQSVAGIQKIQPLMQKSYTEQVQFYMNLQQQMASMMGGMQMPGTSPVAASTQSSGFMR